MTQIPAYTLTNESVTIVVDGKPYTTQKGSPNFPELRKAILEERWEDIPKHVTIAKSLNEWAKGCFTVEGSTVKFGGEPVPNNINRRLFQMAAEGKDPTSVFNFWERLQKNPSFRSVNQLWDFLQHEGIPLTEDGCFLAYKSVRHDYKDHHSGQFTNSPGTINKMPRNQISDDPNVACHDGFHVGALAYASTFCSGNGARIVIVKVDPMNVVCVPYDCSSQKMRVCEYEVIGHHNGAEEMPSTTMTTPEEEDYDEDFDGDGDENSNEDEKEEQPSQGKIVDLMDQETDKGVKPVEPKRKAVKGWAKFDKMGMAELLEQPIHELRWYAGRGLKIVGASKIPGGKAALVSRILEVRE